jgi:DNA-binding response OmpR family regulator
MSDDRMREMGIATYLTKPLIPQEIATAIRTALSPD